jgi:hypothetical protein
MNEARKRLDKNLEKIKLTTGLLQEGKIATFSAIFIYSNRTFVSKQLGMNYKRLGRLATNPDPLRIREIRAIARFFKVPSRIITNIIFNQVEAPSTKLKK